MGTPSNVKVKDHPSELRSGESSGRHTPGPWTLQDGTWRDMPYFIVEAGGTNWPDGFHLSAVMSKEDARLIAAAPELLSALEAALRYIEVNTAYQGAMTAEEVEKAIKERLPSAVSIGANSCNTLATFNFDTARTAIAHAKGHPHD